MTREERAARKASGRRIMEAWRVALDLQRAGMAVRMTDREARMWVAGGLYQTTNATHRAAILAAFYGHEGV
jgi:hypothetical protein